MLIKSMEISHLRLSYDFSDMLLLNGGIYLTDLYQNCLWYGICASAVGKFIDIHHEFEETHNSVGVGSCGNKRLEE